MLPSGVRAGECQIPPPASPGPTKNALATVLPLVIFTARNSPRTDGLSQREAIASRCDNPSVRGELRAVNMTNGSTVASAFFVGPGEAGGGIWHSPALTPDGSIVAVGTGEDYSCSDCSLTRSMVTMDSNTLAVLQHHQEGNAGKDLDFG